MTVNVTNSSTGPLTASGTTPLAFTFIAASATELEVLRNGTVAAPNTYTVTLNANNTGTVTPLTSFGTDSIIIRSKPNFQQLSRFERYAPWFPDQTNAPFDVAAVRDIYLKGETDRAIKVPVGQTAPDYPTFVSTLKGDPGGYVGAVGPFTSISGLLISAGVDAIYTSEYRAGSGKGAGRYLRWKVPLAALPAVGAGENAWWAQSADGGRWYPDPEQLHIYHLGLFGNAAQYGLDPSGDHDDYGAYLALKSFALWVRTNVNVKTATIPKVRLPGTTAYSSGTWEFNFGTVTLEGPTAGGEEGGHGFSLCIAGGIDGIVVDKDNTTGGTTRASAPGGQGSTFKNMEVWTRSAGGSATACGIKLRARANLENTSAWNFPQDGLNVNVTSGGGSAVEGEASMVRVLGGEFHHNGRHGAHFQGGDANIAILTNVTVMENAEWGYSGREFLGNALVACHSKSNARRGESGPTYAPKTSITSVSYGGNVYSVRFGQEAGASTNAPSGTATSNTWWVYRGAGAPATLNPLWVSGMTIVSGGAYLVSDPNSSTTLFGCYSESDHPGSWLAAKAQAIGGQHAAGIQGGQLQSIGGVMVTAQGIGFLVTADSTGIVSSAHFGSASGDPSILMEFGRNAAAPNEWRMLINSPSQDWGFAYGFSAGTTPFNVTGPATTYQFGTGVAQPYKFLPSEIFLGVADAARRITMAAAAPTTGPHGKGEIVWNDYSSTTTPEYWRCTVAGTPGTWVAKP